jgi:hypothetical protein
MAAAAARRTVSASAILWTCACASVGAPGPVIADRPGYTDAPTVLPAHGVQLEAGVTDDIVTAHHVEPRTEYRTFGESLLRLGVGARTELRLFGNSYATRLTRGSPTVSGLEDVKIGAKVNIRDVPDSIHSWLPDAALLAATTLGTGANGITAGAAQQEAKLAINWTTATPFSLYANLVYGFSFQNTGLPRRSWASIAGWWSVNPRVSAFLEGLDTRMPGSAFGVFQNNVWLGAVDGGLTYLVNDRFQLDLRAGRGVGSWNSSEQFFGAGFARRW